MDLYSTQGPPLRRTLGSQHQIMKRHLYRTIGDQLFTYEEFATVDCQIESFLKFWPLSAISDEPQDFTALTSGHFLIDRALSSLPEHTFEVSESVTPCIRWRLVNQIKNHFWKRWVHETLLHFYATTFHMAKPTTLNPGEWPRYYQRRQHSTWSMVLRSSRWSYCFRGSKIKKII